MFLWTRTWTRTRRFGTRKCPDPIPEKKITRLDALLPSHTRWFWFTEHSNYENEMYLLWTNFYILNKVSKPHDSGSQNIQDIEMKCSSCEKTFWYVLNEASKPHEIESQNIQTMKMKCTFCEQTFTPTQWSFKATCFWFTEVVPT